MDLKKILDDSNRYLFNTYNRFPVALRKGRGIKVWGYDDKEYTDFREHAEEVANKLNALKKYQQK